MKCPTDRNSGEPALQFGFIFAWLGYAGFADKKTPKEWNDLSLLKGETGKIKIQNPTKTAEAEPLLTDITVFTFSDLMSCVKRDTICKIDTSEETICHELQ